MKHHGFTLVELMVTLAIVAIVLTIGVPSFQSVMRNNQLTTQINSLVGAIHLARSEAIKRGEGDAPGTDPDTKWVVICAAASGNTCSTTTPKTDWSNGWIVFLNRTSSAIPSPIPAADILKIYEAMPSGYTLKATSNYVAYDKTSFSKKVNGTSNTLTFALCYDSTTYSRELTVASVGRARVKGKPVDSDEKASTCTP